MFIKVTNSGPRRYVQLVEAFRDEAGLPKQRTVATLGRLDQLNSGLDSVISGLLRVTGRKMPQASAPEVEFESARDFGDVWTLNELWNTLGFDRMRVLFRRTRHAIDVESLIRVMVFNRLCDPDSKLGVLRWLETVSMPGLKGQAVEHQHLLRAMDALVAQHEAVENVLSSLLRPLVDQDLAVVFYDMTTIRTEGLSEQSDDLRPGVRHQMTQVVDLYRGAFKTLHYKRLIWGSREGFLMLNADRICECSCVMVDKPLSGADLFKTIF